jgi:hypothetical protein
MYGLRLLLDIRDHSEGGAINNVWSFVYAPLTNVIVLLAILFHNIWVLKFIYMYEYVINKYNNC